MLYNIRNDDVFKINPVFSSEPKAGFRSESLLVCERCIVAPGEEAVEVRLGVPVFVAVTGVAEETVVSEAFQVTVFDAEECYQRFVVVDASGGFIRLRIFKLCLDFVEEGEYLLIFTTYEILATTSFYDRKERGLMRKMILRLLYMQ